MLGTVGDGGNGTGATDDAGATEGRTRSADNPVSGGM
jgi:hypothetical protein